MKINVIASENFRDKIHLFFSGGWRCGGGLLHRFCYNESKFPWFLICPCGKYFYRQLFRFGGKLMLTYITYERLKPSPCLSSHPRKKDLSTVLLLGDGKSAIVGATVFTYLNG